MSSSGVHPSTSCRSADRREPLAPPHFSTFVVRPASGIASARRLPASLICGAGLQPCGRCVMERGGSPTRTGWKPSRSRDPAAAGQKNEDLTYRVVTSPGVVWGRVSPHVSARLSTWSTGPLGTRCDSLPNEEWRFAWVAAHTARIRRDARHRHVEPPARPSRGHQHHLCP